MSAKACVACTKWIPATARECGFCGHAQPSVSGAPEKEARCATCKRPYAATLERCPFCERDRAAGVAPTAFGPTTSLSPPVFVDDTPDEGSARSLLSSAGLLAAPLLVGAAWGLWEIAHLVPLGGAESSGPWRAGIALGALAAPLLGVAFVRRVYRSTAAAAEAIGATRALLLGAGVALLSLAPAIVLFAGLASFVNGTGTDAREQIVDCKLGSIWNRTRGVADMGWHMSYFCELGGERLAGSTFVSATRPDFVEGGLVRFRAARGRLGYWIRLSDPSKVGEIPLPAASVRRP